MLIVVILSAQYYKDFFLFVEIILLVITNPALSIMLLRYDGDTLHAKTIGFDDHYITLISELTPYTWVWCQHVESQYIYRKRKKKKLLPLIVVYRHWTLYSGSHTLSFMVLLGKKKKLIVRFRDPKKSREPEQHYVADI